MPYISVHHSHPSLTDQQSQAISLGITTVMHEVLGKRAELAAVTLQPVASQQWSIAAEPLSRRQQVSVFVQVFITAGTNSESEKAQAIASLYQLLAEQLGPLAQASYIVIQEIPATDWGYDGHTQQSRRS